MKKKVTEQTKEKIINRTEEFLNDISKELEELKQLLDEHDEKQAPGTPPGTSSPSSSAQEFADYLEKDLAPFLKKLEKDLKDLDEEN